MSLTLFKKFEAPLTEVRRSTGRMIYKIFLLKKFIMISMKLVQLLSTDLLLLHIIVTDLSKDQHSSCFISARNLDRRGSRPFC